MTPDHLPKPLEFDQTAVRYLEYKSGAAAMLGQDGAVYLHPHEQPIIDAIDEMAATLGVDTEYYVANEGRVFFEAEWLANLCERGGEPESARSIREAAANVREFANLPTERN